MFLIVGGVFLGVGLWLVAAPPAGQRLLYRIIGVMLALAGLFLVATVLVTLLTG